MKKKVALRTLGCKLNYAEGDTILRNFQHAGYEAVDFKDHADVYIINTCTVTHVADKKSRALIRQAIKHNKEAIIIVTGCYAQVNAEQIANQIPEIDYIIDNVYKKSFFTPENIKKLKKHHISPEILKFNSKQKNIDFFPSYSINFRTRSFLKVQDGCNYTCNYCTIPFTRGNSRNASISEIIQTTKNLIKANVKEIVLTGINIGDFGKSTGETFYELLKALDKIKDNIRFRISSIEPNLITTDIIKLISNSDKFVNHFHIPLQSGSNNVLKAMQRRYNTKLFESKIEEINKFIPNTGIGIDVITGYPTETKTDFDTTVNFLENLNFSYLHVFTYSPRPLAKSYKMKIIATNKEITERSKILHNLSNKKREKFLRKNLGKELIVLFESDKIKNKIYGLTDNYIRVYSNFEPSLINSIKKVKILKVEDVEKNLCSCKVIE